METPIRIGISSCLLGEKVRFDGGHQRDRYLTDTLGLYLEWVPVCPEVELGLGAPREPIQLIQCGGGVKLRTTGSQIDWTRPMRAFAKARVAALAKESISGYVLKENSPSCGMERVKVHRQGGGPRREGTGLFAQALRQRFPQLPVEEAARLGDPRRRENWIERVFAYHALQALWMRRWRIGDLAAFHARYRLVLLAHSEKAGRALGQLVGAAASIPRAALRGRYQAGFMTALERVATVAKNSRVLRHVFGRLERQLDADGRRELLAHIEDYRNGLVPLVVPLTLLRHYVRLLDVASLRDQAYLDPDPRELALRYRV